MKMKPSMDPTAFRDELVKIMPGYEWTIHRNLFKDSTYFRATGIQSSGFNRLSTLQVVKRKRIKDSEIEYEVKSSGFGKKTPWLSEATRSTLAQALRALQDHYEHMAATYRGHATALKDGRKVATTEE